METVCALSVWFFFLGRVHMISTGPISTVQTEVRGPAILLDQKENSSYKL
ncbi:unnamed protein product [Staurois parvus]|uniref:Uncharacterized protein n=1 Tax=Staurois parvus TaxID=386267 RepID=A0ABN9ARU0_9NEOB|nr:unnamed protein product [Staurois parvus]